MSITDKTTGFNFTNTGQKVCKPEDCSKCSLDKICLRIYKGRKVVKLGLLSTAK